MWKRKFFALAAMVGVARSAGAYDINDWPTHYTASDGTDLGLIFQYFYDWNEFNDDRRRDGTHAFDDVHSRRRTEFGWSVKKKGVYDAVVAYEDESRLWQDVFLRLQSKAFFDRDYGAFRLGHSKTPVSFEGNTAAKASTFIEFALPTQAIFENRRTGVDWQFERPHYLANLGYYFGHDLAGRNEGTTIGGRIAWTPRKADGDLLHVGLTASHEARDGSTDGQGIYHAPSARISALPEAGLARLRLVDTGSLGHVESIGRVGLEGLWIRGPWSIQAEWLGLDADRRGNPDFSADGSYIFASWLATGESRPYASGIVGNIKPRRRWGALELALRYSQIDLDDGDVLGGEQHNWTLGANWYLTQHFKFQFNYVRAFSDRGDLSFDPTILELRGMILF